MANSREALEIRFEEMMLEVLTQDYDLDVRRWGDAIDRRRKNVGILCFDYHWARGEEAKVVVTVDGVDDFSFITRVDFRDSEKMRLAIEDCEPLALLLIEYLDECREEATSTEAQVYGDGRGRREDDLR